MSKTWNTISLFPESLPRASVSTVILFGALSAYTDGFNYVFANLSEKNLVQKVDPILSKGHMQKFRPILSHTILLYLKQFYKLPEIFSATRKCV